MERYSSLHAIFLLIRHNNSLSAMFRRNTRFIDLVHCLMNYTTLFKLEYNVQFIPARTFDIACDIQSSCVIQDASLSTFCRYTSIAKNFLKNNKVFTFLMDQSRLHSVGHYLVFVYFDTVTSFFQ